MRDKGFMKIDTALEKINKVNKILKKIAAVYLKRKKKVVEIKEKVKRFWDGDGSGCMVGVEIECIVPNDRVESLDKECNKLGVDVDNDGSIEPGVGNIGREYKIKLYPDTDKIPMVITYHTLKKLCDAMTEHKVTVNESCGLHVHIDMRHLDNSDGCGMYRAHEIANRIHYGFIQNIGSKMVPRERIGKYKFLNWNMRPDITNRTAAHASSYGGTKKTVEVRLHHGTIDYDDIYHWSEFCRLASKEYINLKTLNKTHPHLYKFYKKKVELYAPKPQVLPSVSVAGNAMAATW